MLCRSIEIASWVNRGQIDYFVKTDIFIENVFDYAIKLLLGAFPQLQRDVETQMFHFKMCVRQKLSIAKLNRPYNAMHKEYFNTFPHKQGLKCLHPQVPVGGF